HHPRGGGRVESPGQQAYGLAFDAKWKASHTRPPTREEQNVLITDFQLDLDLRVVQVDGRARVERRSEPPHHVPGAERVASAALGANGVSSTTHPIGEGLDPRSD